MAAPRRPPPASARVESLALALYQGLSELDDRRLDAQLAALAVAVPIVAGDRQRLAWAAELFRDAFAEAAALADEPGEAAP